MTTQYSNRFNDDIIVVTGSTRGIGKGIAHRFASEGATVVVTGRTEEDGKAVATALQDVGAESCFIRADMRRESDIEELMTQTANQYGSIDILVNNAGVQTPTSTTEATTEDWELVVETDLRSYWLCSKYAVSHMPPGSSIVNISSNHAFNTVPGLFPYNAVKAAINGLTRAMALDLGPETRVNTINPGWIAVERTSKDMDEKTQSELASMHPVGRIGNPDDVASAAAFLASDEAGFITGSSLLIDGGRTVVMQDNYLPDYSE